MTPSYFNNTYQLTKTFQGERNNLTFINRMSQLEIIDFFYKCCQLEKYDFSFYIMWLHKNVYLLKRDRSRRERVRYEIGLKYRCFLITVSVTSKVRDICLASIVLDHVVAIYYSFHRSTRLCAVAVFVGLGMSKEQMRTKLPAAWWTWQYQVPDDEDAPRRHGTNIWRAWVLPRMWL